MVRFLLNYNKFSSPNPNTHLTLLTFHFNFIVHLYMTKVMKNSSQALTKHQVSI